LATGLGLLRIEAGIHFAGGVTVVLAEGEPCSKAGLGLTKRKTLLSTRAMMTSSKVSGDVMVLSLNCIPSLLP
jgi:hypothetical protein